MMNGTIENKMKNGHEDVQGPISLGGKPGSVSVSLTDCLLAGTVALFLTLVNCLYMFASGEATFWGYDPIAYVEQGQQIKYMILHGHPIHSLLTKIIGELSGIWNLLFALVMIVGGDGLWQPNLVLFVPTFLLLLMAAWLGRVYGGPKGRLIAVFLTALLPPICFGFLEPLRAAYAGTSVNDLLFPTNTATQWAQWKGQVFKPDLLATAALIWSIGYLAVAQRAPSARIFAYSAAWLGAAIILKGHFAPVYLASWGMALVVSALTLRNGRAAYIWKSYWGLPVLIPLLAIWNAFGGFESALGYIASSLLHPLRASAAYQRGDLGFLYFLALYPTAVGMAGILLGALFVLGYVRTRGAAFRDVVAPAAPFLAGGFTVAAFVLPNPFGKNFTMALPIYALLWSGCIPALMISLTGVFADRRTWRALIIVLAVFGAGFIGAAALRSVYKTHDQLPSVAVARDRAMLFVLAQDIAALSPKRLLMPLTSTGFPAVMKYVMTGINGGPSGTPLIIGNLYGWDQKAILENANYRAARLVELQDYEAVVVVAGGPSLHPFLGAYMSASYAFVEQAVADPRNGFALVNSYNIPALVAPHLYFDAGGNPMQILLYRRQR